MHIDVPISSFIHAARIMTGWFAAAIVTISVTIVVAGTAQAQTPASVDPRLGCDQAPVAPPPDFSVPDNIDFFKKRLLYYRCTGYDNDIAKVLGDARKWVAARAPEVTRPAIVLDIDETSLLNWPRIYTDDYAYFPSFPGEGCDFKKVGDPVAISTGRRPAARSPLSRRLNSISWHAVSTRLRPAAKSKSSS
jgi:hypothetical protein